MHVRQKLLQKLTSRKRLRNEVRFICFCFFYFFLWMGFLSSMHIETFTLDSFTFYLIPYLYQLVSILLINYRVLSMIYRLGEKSRVAQGQELPRGARGHAPPEISWNEYALRCNLVHFETQFWEMCTDLVASGWFFRYSYLYTVMITIFLGGGKLGILRGKLLPLKYPR